MTCGYCDLEFDADARPAQYCGACVLSKGCGRVRCPRCGYEMPEEPVLIKKLRAWKEAWNARKSRA